MSGTVTKAQLEFQHRWLHVWFEQGRGKSGIPKITIESYNDETIESLLRKAVALMIAACENPTYGHGKNIMPSNDFNDYQFHQLEGGMIEDEKGIVWIERQDKHKVASVVLTWGLPSELLMETIRSSQ